jgi:hypothetical protein
MCSRCSLTSGCGQSDGRLIAIGAGRIDRTRRIDGTTFRRAAALVSDDGTIAVGLAVCVVIMTLFDYDCGRRSGGGCGGHRRGSLLTTSENHKGPSECGSDQIVMIGLLHGDKFPLLRGGARVWPSGNGRTFRSFRSRAMRPTAACPLLSCEASLGGGAGAGWRARGWRGRSRRTGRSRGGFGNFRLE